MLDTDYQKFIHKTRYARWIDSEKRREEWEDTVDRYVDFISAQATSHGYQLNETVYHEIRDSILNLEVMPSMRALMTAGTALSRDNIAGYNCAFIDIDTPRAFDEVVYVLMCGTGVGFSVEARNIDKLPIISEEMYETDTTIRVVDSKIGWAKAYRELLSLLYAGQIPRWDTSKIRPAGDRLRTFGGRASGPEPLEDLFRFTIEVFTNARGRRLRPIEVHDIVCKIADIVVVGGVRRSALISLSDLNDSDMRASKFGAWWESNGQRRLANNSAIYRCTPSMSNFLSEWRMLYESKSGERGIFNREACVNKIKEVGRRDPDYHWGTNPCSEIILRSCQLCNLTEVVIRADDTVESLKRKTRVATIIGTIQSTLTDFRYVRNIWKRNCEEERLLGVSLTGIMDHPVMNGTAISSQFYDFIGPEDEPTYITLAEVLQDLREIAVDTNKLWAERFSINQSTAITCVKPSGTVSKLVNTSSGIHGRFAPHYIQRIRNDIKDPITQFFVDQGMPYEVDVMNKDNLVFSFPIKSPDTCRLSRDMSAIEQLNMWLYYQDYWCEHKPSCTIYYKEEEFLAVGDWIYKNFDKISGVSFIPFDDHTYQQAPWEKIDEEEYNKMVSEMPAIEWDRLREYEEDDNTTSSQELACTGGSCEINV